jgi:hypothetical protein
MVRSCVRASVLATTLQIPECSATANSNDMLTVSTNTLTCGFILRALELISFNAVFFKLVLYFHLEICLDGHIV